MLPALSLGSAHQQKGMITFMELAEKRNLQKVATRIRLGVIRVPIAPNPVIRAVLFQLPIRWRIFTGKR